MGKRPNPLRGGFDVKPSLMSGFSFGSLSSPASCTKLVERQEDGPNPGVAASRVVIGIWSGTTVEIHLSEPLLSRCCTALKQEEPAVTLALFYVFIGLV